jgi:sortase B
MSGGKCVKDKGRYRLLRAALAVVTIACLLPVGRSCCLSIRHERQQRQLQKLKTESGANKPLANTEQKQEGQGNTGLQNLSEENHDLVGWLTIDGTKIDYPVMQCEDDTYYLSHNFQKEEDKYGCLYVKSIADVETPGTNIIIYGHNMKDGSMFGELDRYDSETFGREHQRITFDTLYEEREYQVMAVFRTQISENDDGRFQYYQFYEAQTEEEFDEFYEHVARLSIYDTGVTAEFGDTFLTLSTCTNYAENGRLVVVAKRIVK